MVEPASVTSRIASLIKICNRTSQELEILNGKLKFARFAIALLSVECSITLQGLLELEQALSRKPDLLVTSSHLQTKTIACLEIGIEGIILIFAHLDDTLDVLKAALKEEASKAHILDSDEKLQHEDLLKKAANQVRDQTSSINVLLAYFKLNFDTEDSLSGISLVAETILRRNYAKAKSLRSLFDSGNERISELQDHGLESVSKSKTIPEEPLSNPRQRESIANSTREVGDAVDSSRLSKASTLLNNSEWQTDEAIIVDDSSQPNTTSKKSDAEYHTAIEDGIIKGNVPGVEALLQEAVVVNCIPLFELDKTECTFLARAIQANSTEMARLLLKYCADPESIALGSVGYTALQWAVSCNHIAMVELLLQEGADVKKQSMKYRETALFIACRKGYLDLVKVLLQGSGTSALEIVGRDNRAPLLEAAFLGFLEIVEYLLQAGADVHRKDTDGNTSLHIVAKDGNTVIAKLLIASGAEIDARGQKNKTPLHVAACFGHIAMAQLLMDYGTEIDAADENKRTPLHIAVRDGRIAVAELLVKWGAELEAKEEDDWTPLHCAIHHKRHDIIKLLLLSGALGDAMSSTGKRPLMRAAANDDLTSLKLLHEHGADLNVKTRVGWTAMHFAAEAGAGNAIRFLVSKGVSLEQPAAKGWTAIHFAAEAGLTDTLKVLISEGASLELPTANGSTPLMVAAQHGRTEAVKILCEAKVQVENHGGKTFTPLNGAACTGKDAVCEVILDHGAAIESRDVDGQTPLMGAAVNNHLAVIKLLLRRGASVNAQDKNRLSALYHACITGSTDIIEELLAAGASVHIRSKHGATPLHIAAYKGHRAAVELLLRNGSDRAAISKHNNLKGTPAVAAKLQGHQEIADLINDFKISPAPVATNNTENFRDASKVRDPLPKKSKAHAPPKSFIADDKGHVWPPENSSNSKSPQGFEKFAKSWTTGVSGRSKEKK